MNCIILAGSAGESLCQNETAVDAVSLIRKLSTGVTLGRDCGDLFELGAPARSRLCLFVSEKEQKGLLSKVFLMGFPCA